MLQLSALSQHTYTTSDLLHCMLTSLQDKLSHFTKITSGGSGSSLHSSPAIAPPTKIPDHSILRWMVMLLSHFLSSVVSASPQCNLFTPLPMNPPSVNSTEGVRKDSKEKEESKDVVMEVHKEVKKMLSRVHDVMQSSGSEVDKMAVKQQLESKLNVRQGGEGRGGRVGQEGRAVTFLMCRLLKRTICLNEITHYGK